jgi:hypothetical protein
MDGVMWRHSVRGRVAVLVVGLLMALGLGYVLPAWTASMELPYTNAGDMQVQVPLPTRVGGCRAGSPSGQPAAARAGDGWRDLTTRPGAEAAAPAGPAAGGWAPLGPGLSTIGCGGAGAGPAAAAAATVPGWGPLGPPQATPAPAEGGGWRPLTPSR